MHPRPGVKPGAGARRRVPSARRNPSLRTRLALLLLGAPLLLLATGTFFHRRALPSGAAPYRRLGGVKKQGGKAGATYEGPLRPDAFGSLPDITYLGNEELDKRLGCPAATHGCFYSFADDASAHALHASHVKHVNEGI